jgi:putative addiction module component (TIGR02574 family)
MPTDLEQLTARVLALPESSRAQLADTLLSSLPHPQADRSEAWWQQEIERRCREIAEGKVESIPGEEVMRRARERLRRCPPPSDATHIKK